MSQKDLDKLFGPSHQLKKFKSLSQPYQFAAKETVILRTLSGELSLRVVSPIREKTQVELARTDAKKLKINPPIRLSGDLKDSAGGILVGPKGQIKLKEGIIIAQRHIHTDPAAAKRLNLKNGQTVSVKTFGERSLTFHQVSVRIKDGFLWRMHLDTDEGNASLPDGTGGKGELII